MIPALFYGDPKTGTYELRHLFIALFGLATVPAVFAYASLARMPGLPLLAVLALATMPRFYGDWFNNSKDVPFACLFALSMYMLAVLLRRRPLAPWHVLACGVAFGLALDVRPGGVPRSWRCSSSRPSSCRSRSRTGRVWSLARAAL